jgi:hypothetical protein
MEIHIDELRFMKEALKNEQIALTSLYILWVFPWIFRKKISRYEIYEQIKICKTQVALTKLTIKRLRG